MDISNLLTRQRQERTAAEERLRETGPDGSHLWEPAHGYSTDRVEAAAALEAIRRRICAYGGHGSCDCKYGLGIVLAAGRPGSEATGCPELRSAVRMLLHPEETA